MIIIKYNNIFYRFLKCEQGKDKSFYIRHIYSLNTKSSYHTGHGKMKPPFEYHLYGCNGKKIERSINRRNKFITEYREKSFANVNFNKISDGIESNISTRDDVIYDLNNQDIANFSFDFFSDYRQDLLKNKFDNAIIKKLEFIDYNLILGLFWKPIYEK